MRSADVVAADDQEHAWVGSSRVWSRSHASRTEKSCRHELICLMTEVMSTWADTSTSTQLGRQAVAALVTIAYSGLLTLAIAFLVDKTLGLRATWEAELTGIDEDEHAETAYDRGRFATHHTAVTAPSDASR